MISSIVWVKPFRFVAGERLSTLVERLLDLDKVSCYDSTITDVIKRQLSFQQAICYLSLRWVNIIYGQRILWTDCLKIQKHITAIGILDWLLMMQMGKVRFGWRGDCCDVFWILEQSVYRISWVWYLVCLLLIACHANGSDHTAKTSWLF